AIHMLEVNVTKQLKHFILQIHFKIKHNEIIALFGPSGSGKTTILNCIAGIDTPDAGIIRFSDHLFYSNGKNLVPTQSRQVGYLFQEFALFPHMTVWENIKYGMKSEVFAQHLMRDLMIDHLQDEYPHNISGGEQQRVALARALATEP